MKEKSPIKSASGINSKNTDKEIHVLQKTIADKNHEIERVKDEIRNLRTSAAAEKMSAMSRLAGGIVHDLNNIFGTIMLNVELAFDDVLENSEANYSLNQISKVCNRAKEFLEKLSLFSNRDDDDDRKPLNIGTIVSETLQSFAPKIPENIEIERTISDNVRPIKANADQIKQAIIQICDNALQAMDNVNGVLNVTLQNISPDRCPFPVNSNIETYVKLAFSDTGIGIPKEILNHIYDPFFSKYKNSKRAGLGLSIVHGIVTNHHGTIIVDSTPGEGSVFAIYFPACKTAHSASDNKQKSLEYPI